MIRSLIMRAVLAFAFTLLIAYIAGNIYFSLFVLFLLILFIVLFWEIYEENK